MLECENNEKMIEFLKKSYGRTSLKSKYPDTRCFTSNKNLALKYYRYCAILLNKKGILVNLSQ